MSSVTDAGQHLKSIRNWWVSLETDWQAVIISILLVVLVSTGISIPW